MPKTLEEVTYINQTLQNKARRTIIVFLIDSSLSMSIKEKGEEKSKIQVVNEKIPAFLHEMAGDVRVKDSLVVSVVEFSDSAKLLVNFDSPEVAANQIKSIEAKGSQTCLGAGIQLAYDNLKEYINILKSGGIEYYRPIFIIVTDGEATDTVKTDEMAKVIRSDFRIRVKCFNLSDKNDKARESLRKFVISDKDIQNINSLGIAEYFDSLSRSITAASRQAIETDI